MAYLARCLQPAERTLGHLDEDKKQGGASEGGVNTWQGIFFVTDLGEMPVPLVTSQRDDSRNMFVHTTSQKLSMQKE